jgi:hypothetical protein
MEVRGYRSKGGITIPEIRHEIVLDINIGCSFELLFVQKRKITFISFKHNYHE